MTQDLHIWKELTSFPLWQSESQTTSSYIKPQVLVKTGVTSLVSLFEDWMSCLRLLLWLLYVLGKMSNYSTKKQTIQARPLLEGTNSSAEMLNTDNWTGFWLRILKQILEILKGYEILPCLHNSIFVFCWEGTHQVPTGQNPDSTEMRLLSVNTLCWNQSLAPSPEVALLQGLSAPFTEEKCYRVGPKVHWIGKP